MGPLLHSLHATALTIAPAGLAAALQGSDLDPNGGVEIPFGSDLNPLQPTGADSAMTAFVVLFVIVAVVAVVLGVRNASVYLKRGIDPTTVDAEMKARLLQSPMLTGGDQLSSVGTGRGTVQDRLAEIDRLQQAGAISEAERAAARGEVLREL